MRLCLKSTFVFAILVGLSSAFAQRSPIRSESIVVFAPHPDDEVIGCAGIIMQALARGAHVKVVDITSGDGFDAAAAGSLTKKWMKSVLILERCLPHCLKIYTLKTASRWIRDISARSC